jgi:hypothetical protein
VLAHFNAPSFAHLGVGSLLQLLALKPHLIDSLSPPDSLPSSAAHPTTSSTSAPNAAPAVRVRMAQLLRATCQAVTAYCSAHSGVMSQAEGGNASGNEEAVYWVAQALCQQVRGCGHMCVCVCCVCTLCTVLCVYCVCTVLCVYCAVCVLCALCCVCVLCVFTVLCVYCVCVLRAVCVCCAVYMMCGCVSCVCYVLRVPCAVCAACQC